MRRLIQIIILMAIVVNVLPLLDISLPNFGNKISKSNDDHKIESLDIYVSLNKDGSATIKEDREVELSEGTENFIVISNLGKSKITDFIVHGDGNEYTHVDDWNIDWSRENKSGKSGIINKGDSYELVWGIGDYGKHSYKLEYTVTDFIKQLKDSQIVFWQFVNPDTNIPPESVSVTIEADKELNDQNESIWAFGFEGDIHFEKGKIVAKSNEPLLTSDYVTVLTEFRGNDFSSDDILNKTFVEIKEEAFAGSDYNLDNDESEYRQSINPSIYFPLLIFLGIFFFRFIGSPRKIIQKAKRRKYKGKYVREVPYEEHFHIPYGLLKQNQLSEFKDVLSAYILKWILEERLIAIGDHKFEINDSRKESLDSLESELFSFFEKSVNEDGILEKSSFRKWASENKSSILEWELKIREQSFNKLEKDGYILKGSKTSPFLNKKLTKAGKELEGSYYKFKNYLKDYSLLSEQESTNVHIWDKLMIWASVLGITDEVYKEFKRLYPAYETESRYTPSVITTATSYSRIANNEIRPTSRSSSGSSGSGGSSSRRGGGGSFGGGRGGGTR